MTSPPEYSFRTKTGTCTITAERIVLAREGPRGALATSLLGSSIRRVLFIYGATGLSLLGLGVVAHRPRPPFTRGYFAVVFDDAGTERTRLIMLPGTGSNGAAEYAKAEQAMTEAGLIAAR